MIVCVSYTIYFMYSDIEISVYGWNVENFFVFTIDYPDHDIS